MKYNEIPTKPHFAAIVSGSITIPGDERSRTCPGHGYPESTQSTRDYIAFESEVEMNEWVAKRQEREWERHNFRVLFVSPCEISVSTKVAVSRP